MIEQRERDLVTEFKALRARWRQEDLGIVVEEKSNTPAIPSKQKKISKMPKRIGKTDRDKTKKLLKASMREIVEAKSHEFDVPASILHFTVKRRIGP